MTGLLESIQFLTVPLATTIDKSRQRNERYTSPEVITALLAKESRVVLEIKVIFWKATSNYEQEKKNKVKNITE